MIPFSILDLAPIRQGYDAAEAFRTMRDQALHAERLGFHRYWLAEHHNMIGIGSSATSVLIGHVAEATKTLRVGAGGVMLSNHAPLVIAEQFGTLATLYPDRIDLGLGRAPGTDQITAWALRRDLMAAGDNFPRDVEELQAYFMDPEPGQAVRAVPGAGLPMAIWLLGSSLFSAQLAAHLGLPYAFASHFAPDLLLDALKQYREGFQPSGALNQPYTMAGLNVVAAETDEDARRLFTSVQQGFTNLVRGRPGLLQPPVDNIDGYWSPAERATVERMAACSVVGSPSTVRDGIAAFIEKTGVDEIITTVRIFDHRARLKSLEILADVRGRLE